MGIFYSVGNLGVFMYNLLGFIINFGLEKNIISIPTVVTLGIVALFAYVIWRTTWVPIESQLNSSAESDVAFSYSAHVTTPTTSSSSNRTNSSTIHSSIRRNQHSLRENLSDLFQEDPSYITRVSIRQIQNHNEGEHNIQGNSAHLNQHQSNTTNESEIRVRTGSSYSDSVIIPLQVILAIVRTRFLPHLFHSAPNPQSSEGSSNNIAEQPTSPPEQPVSPQEQSRVKPEAESNTTMDQGSQEGPPLKFVIKFMNDTQVEIITTANEKIGQFKRRHFSQEISERKKIKLIFNGRVLNDDNLTLSDYGIFENCAVHCLIQNPTDTPTIQRAASGANRRGPEPGVFFVVVLGFILVGLWFVCFKYGQQLFTQSAVVSLSVLTGIFLIGLVAFYLPVTPQNNNNN